MVNNISAAELISGISSKCGVRESEAKNFFEIFLMLLSKKMQPGDYLFIEGTGYFHLRNAISRTPGSTAVKKDIKVILFSKELSSNPSVKDHLVFNIPGTEEEEDYNPSDFHFSLSIGKPVIPLRGSDSSGYMPPPAGPELRGLLYSKAEKLISGSTIHKRTDVNARQVIIPSSEPVRSFQSGSIEAAEILKDTPEPKESDKEIKSLSSEPAVTDKIIDDEVISPGQETVDEIKKPLPVQATEKYEQVRSVRSGPPKPPAPVKAEGKGDFTRISSFKDDKPPKDESEITHPKPVNVGRQEQPQKTSVRQMTNEEDEKIEKSYKGRRLKAGILVMAGLLILSAIAAVVYYSPLFRNEQNQKIMVAQGPIVKPVVIERTYDIPVNYPYDTSLNVAALTFNPVAIMPEQQTVTSQEDQTAVPKQETKIESPHGGSVKIKDNIFRYGEDYVVQVSSWKSLNKAKSEVERFSSMGYRAFLENASLSGKGSYYRVRVGNFKSLEEAESFLRKNI